MTSLVTYPLVSMSKMLPADTLADLVVDSVGKRSDATAVEEALMVRLANRFENPVLMHGREVVDRLPGADKNARLGYQLSPFSRVSGGAQDVVIAQDADKELYVLMGKKEGSGEWSLPAGYMKTRSSFSEQGAFTNDSGARDRFEESMMSGARDSKTPLQSLTAKEPSFDRTLLDTGRRELREETTLDIAPDKFSFVETKTGTGEAKSAGAPQPYQAIDNVFLVDLRSQGSLPPVAPTDDLGSLAWVKLKDIEPSVENGQRVLRVQGAAVGTDYANALEHAVGRMRAQEYEARGVSAEGARSIVQTAKPESELGAAAIAWHNETLEAVARVQKLIGSLKRPGPSGEVSR